MAEEGVHVTVRVCPSFPEGDVPRALALVLPWPVGRWGEPGGWEHAWEVPVLLCIYPGQSWDSPSPAGGLQLGVLGMSCLPGARALQAGMGSPSA